MIFTSVDYEKFRALRVTHVATRFEELINDEANDTLTPEKLFLTAVDDALKVRRANKIEKLIRAAGFPILDATIAECVEDAEEESFSRDDLEKAAGGDLRGYIRRAIQKAGGG